MRLTAQLIIEADPAHGENRRLVEIIEAIQREGVLCHGADLLHEAADFADLLKLANVRIEEVPS